MIRTFKKSDKSQVIALISKIQRKEFNIQITPEHQPDLQNIPQFYQKNDGNFWVAIDKGGLVIGTIALLGIGHHEGALRKMFVRSDYRGMGIAKQLLETLFKWARGHQMHTIYLGTTTAFLAAHRFYEKNGFIECSEKDLPSSFPIMSVDKKFYRITL